MKRVRLLNLIPAIAAFCMHVAYGTNGDNLIGVGPVSRSMGGAGVAMPQDPVGTIFANPAGLGSDRVPAQPRAMFSGTLFDPTVKAHDGWNPMGATTIQGTMTPTFGNEYFRVIGFPGVVETHATAGFGYRLTETASLDCSYMHAFEETIRETSAGNAFTLESSLEEKSFTASLAFQF